MRVSWHTGHTIADPNFTLSFNPENFEITCFLYFYYSKFCLGDRQSPSHFFRLKHGETCVNVDPCHHAWRVLRLRMERSYEYVKQSRTTETHYAITSRHQNVIQHRNIVIGNSSFEYVEMFKYLGVTVTNSNDIREEIRYLFLSNPITDTHPTIKKIDLKSYIKRII